MTDTNLPETVSQNVAAALIGRSPRFVGGLIAKGALLAWGDGWRRIPLAEIENIAGKPVTVADYLAARAKASRTVNHAGEHNRTVSHECPAAA